MVETEPAGAPEGGQGRKRHSKPKDAEAQDIVLAAPVQYRVVEMIPAAPATLCPVCGYTVTPILSYEPSPLAWILCILVSILLFPIFLIGFIIGYFILVSDAMQEPKYICPVCGSFIRLVPLV